VKALVGVILAALAAFVPSTPAFGDVRTRLYVSQFQGGKLLAVDLDSSKIVRQIAVDDGAGSIGVAVTSDGKKLFIVDGGSGVRLRTFYAASGKRIAQVDFSNRVLLLGGGPVLHLTADNRLIFADT